MNGFIQCAIVAAACLAAASFAVLRLVRGLRGRAPASCCSAAGKKIGSPSCAGCAGCVSSRSCPYARE
jgi:hypothetical protein